MEGFAGTPVTPRARADWRMPRNSRASELTSAGVRRRGQGGERRPRSDPEADAGEPPGAGGGKQVSGEGLGGLGARVQPCGWARRPQAGSAVSAPPPGRAGSGGVRRARRCGRGPSALSGVRVAGGDRGGVGRVGAQAPARGPVRPGGRPGYRGRGRADRLLSEQIRAAGVLSAAFSRRPVWLLPLGEGDVRSQPSAGLVGQREWGPESLGKGLTSVQLF